MSESLQGYYYLHTNGDLIYKPRQVVDMDPTYFDSPCVRKVWRLHLDRECGWIILVEALALGARKERVDELSSKWGMTDDDAHTFVSRIKNKDGTPKMRLYRDGGQWCATFHDFENIQESQCGFGDTALEALAELAKPGLTPQPPPNTGGEKCP